MQKIKVLLILISLNTIFSGTSAYAGGSCVETALSQTKAALGNQQKLSALYNMYFGEDLARSPVRNRWNKMSAQEQRDQVDHAKSVVMSLSNRFAKYAGANFKWNGNIAFVTYGNVRTIMTVHLTGNGCRMSDLCVKDNGCLSSIIGDVSKMVAK